MQPPFVIEKIHGQGTATAHRMPRLLVLAALIGGIGVAAFLLYRFFAERADTPYPISRNTERSSLMPIIKTNSITGVTTVEAHVPIAVLSEVGTLPRGFPQELIPEQGRTITESLRIDRAAEGYSEYAVSYASQLAASRAAELFSANLRTHDWDIREERIEEGSAVFKAAKERDGAYIILAEVRGETLVKIVYFENGVSALFSL